MTSKDADRQEYEVLDLSERDRAAFFDALIHPAEPNERLVRGKRPVGEIAAEKETDLA